jgi:hypothetical protein
MRRGFMLGSPDQRRARIFPGPSQPHEIACPPCHSLQIYVRPEAKPSFHHPTAHAMFQESSRLQTVIEDQLAPLSMLIGYITRYDFFSSEIASLVFVLSDLLTEGLALMIAPNKFSPACANIDISWLATISTHIPAALSTRCSLISPRQTFRTAPFSLLGLHYHISQTEREGADCPCYPFECLWTLFRWKIRVWRDLMDNRGTLRGLLVTERPLCVPLGSAAHVALIGGSVIDVGTSS